MNESVALHIDAGVARIEIDDGKVNAMSMSLLGAISEAIRQAQASGSIIILQSKRPGIFSAGFDLNVLGGGDAGLRTELVRTGAELAIQLLEYPYPTIGVMQGHAYPMGAFLLLACDLRLSEAGDHRIGMNEVMIGITPPGFAIELARSRLHPAWFNRTVILGEMCTPDDAVAAGFVDKVVPAGLLPQFLDDVIDGLSSIDLPSHAATKLKLRAGTIARMRDAIEQELTASAVA